MDVTLTEEQELLRSSARDFLEAECPRSFVRARVDPPEAPVSEIDPGGASWRPLWDDIAALGWMGLVIPPEYGGAGLGFIDLAVLLEEMGRALFPAPFLSSAVLGGLAVTLGGAEPHKEELLPRIASGELRVTLGQRDDDGDWDPAGPTLVAEPTDRGYALTGRKLFVWDADTAHVMLTSARAPEGPTLFLVETNAPGVDVRRIDFVDRTRAVCEVRLANVEVPVTAVLGELGRATPLLERVNDFARAALAAEACGGAQWALDASVAYAKTREQFGAPIGSFQAIAHKCADMFVQVESARSAAYYAAWAVQEREPDAHVSACMAKAYCADAFARVAGQAIQVHGGLGFTWEQDVHLYYKRAVATQLAFGDSAFTRELAARVLIDAEPARDA